jgi:hypothetical protein
VDDSSVQRWADSGAMALTGRPDCALGPPSGLVEALDRLSSRFPALDAPGLLGERAALMGLWRRGSTSCGGSCRLLRGPTGWTAVSLARDDDLDLVAAWLELDTPPASAPAAWAAVTAHVARRDESVLADRAQLLGLPVARVGEAAVPTARPGVVAERLGDAPARTPDLSGLLVVDLSALWAGPLCGDLLARAGASVVKVESTRRPDGARRGSKAFFDLLNGRKRSVAVDLQDRQGVRVLRHLVGKADIVIEASRPRALAQFGLRGEDAVRSGGPQVWIAITGYGRSGAAGNRVAFGDDAAAAGGLVVWDDDIPLFCADAVADPLTGLTAADACLSAMESGGRWLLDVSMAAVSAALRGPTLPAPPGLTVAMPHARPVARQAPELGADTDAVLADTGATR